MIPSKDAVSYLSTEAFREVMSNPETILLDVRTVEAFREGHLPGAHNQCVYEVSFLENLRKAFPGAQHKHFVVYGESADFKAAEVAFARMQEDGYSNVHVIEGGLRTWIANGGRVEAVSRPPTGKYFPGKLSLDMDRSKLRWIGRNPTNQHEGRIGLKSGWIEMDSDGHLTGGELVVDMKAITCTDIQETKMNQALIAHLSNRDFFETSRYPEASFQMEEADPIQENTPGQPNLRITGKMTLRGVNRNINFRAMLIEVQDGMSFQAQFDINRVLFGAVYGSGSLFERLGMHLVNDLVNIQLSAIFK